MANVKNRGWLQGLWCIGRIRPVFPGDETCIYELYKTTGKNTHAPRDLDQSRAVDTTDTIIFRLMSV